MVRKALNGLDGKNAQPGPSPEHKKAELFGSTFAILLPGWFYLFRPKHPKSHHLFYPWTKLDDPQINSRFE